MTLETMTREQILTQEKDKFTLYKLLIKFLTPFSNNRPLLKKYILLLDIKRTKKHRAERINRLEVELGIIEVPKNHSYGITMNEAVEAFALATQIEYLDKREDELIIHSYEPNKYHYLYPENSHPIKLNLKNENEIEFQL